jgi:mycothione reductase
VPHYDLVIVGAGSGNTLPDETLAHWRIAIIEPDRFGGTCLNRGCIPSKMFVYAADVAQHVRHAGRFGIDARLDGVDWPSIRERVFGRIDPIHESGVAYRRSTGVEVYLSRGRFVAPKVLDVGGTEVTADRFVISAGSRPVVPSIPGLDSVSHHTSDTIMRVEQLPRSMIVLGGGFIAAEMSHVFGALGTQITIVNRGDVLLGMQDVDISRRFTAACAQRFDLRLDSTIEQVEPSPGGLRATVVDARGARTTVEAETLLLAVGRTSNSDTLDPAAGGLEVDEHGHLVTDDSYATAVPGVWALGDVTNHFQLKHMANAEARLVRHNLLHPEAPRRSSFGLAPSAVFSDPQVASVGATEQQLQAEGRDYRVAVREYATTAYGWAMEDTTSFAKVMVDPATGLILGAHIMGPQASSIIQPIIQAMALGNTAADVAQRVLYIHPALTEVIENALLDVVSADD